MQVPDTAANGRAAALPRRVDTRSELDERRLDGGRALGVRLPCDARAPGAARTLVGERLRERVAPGVLDSALLVVSELVTNSVRHSGAGPQEAVIVRVGLSSAIVCLEVEDAGRGGVIALRAPDRDDGGGFGLQLVQTLRQRWGAERVAAGGTLVWARLARTPASAPATGERPADAGRARPALTPITQPTGESPRHLGRKGHHDRTARHPRLAHNLARL